MFYGCSGLSSLDMSKWDTSNVERMDLMFYGCSSLKSLDVSKFVTSKVADMRSMFDGLSKLCELKLGEKFTLPLSSCSLGAPDGSASRDGYVNVGQWRNMTTGVEYDSAAEIPANTAATYTPFKPIAYTVRFDKNEGTGGMDDQLFTYDVAQALSANAFSRENYSFAGWNTQKDGSGKSYSDRESVSNLTDKSDGVVTLYAQWKGDEYGITYSLDGGTLPDSAPKTHTYGTETELPTLTRDGYTFDGWYDEAGAKVTAISASTKKAVALTAHWTANADTKYAVEHYLQNADDDSYTLEATDSKTGTTDTETAAEAKSYTGFTAGKVTQQKIKGDGTTVVKIYYTRVKHDVTFDAKGHGTAPAELAGVKYGAKVTNPGDLSAEGYAFGGWYADEACTKAWDFSTSTMPAGNVTLYAKWTANEYGITYDSAGGTLPDSAPKTHTYGTETELPTPTRDGYVFDGWYDEDGNKIDAIPADAKGMKVLAVWSEQSDDNNGRTDGQDKDNQDQNKDDDQDKDTDKNKDDQSGGNTDSTDTGNTDNGGNTDSADTGNTDNGGNTNTGNTGNTADTGNTSGGKNSTANTASTSGTSASANSNAKSLASTGATVLAVTVTALVLAAVGVTVGVLRRKRSR